MRERYSKHRFPSEIISHAIWLYYRFGISLRDVEDLLAKQELWSSYETIRRWCGKFGPLRRDNGKVDSAIAGSWTKCSSQSTV